MCCVLIMERVIFFGRKCICACYDICLGMMTSFAFHGPLLFCRNLKLLQEITVFQYFVRLPLFPIISLKPFFIEEITSSIVSLLMT